MSFQRAATILAAAVGFFAAESAQAQGLMPNSPWANVPPQYAMNAFGPGGCVIDPYQNPYFYPARRVTRIIDVNCTPVRVSVMRQLPRYIPVPVPVYMPMPQFQPVALGFNQQRQFEEQQPLLPQAQQPAAPREPVRPAAPAAPVVQSPPPVLPRQVNDTPAEPTVRMRYVELTVAGVSSTADADKLSAGLDKIKASRTVTVKRKAGGEATVKVWYSEREPLEADTVIQAVNQLGYKVL